MAEASTTEAVTSPPNAGSHTTERPVATPHAESSLTKPAPLVASGFQAVNRPLVSENEDVTPAPAQPGRTSPTASTVAQHSPQTAQDSSGASAVQSSSSHVFGLDGAVPDAASYGTRSRNRTGNARPNYAEDQDPMELELSTKKKSTGDSTLTTAPAVPDPKRDVARFVPVNGITGAAANLAAPAGKESTPSGSNPPATSSKKRKAGVAPTQLAQTPPASTPATAAARKPVMAAQSTVARETNVLTFTKHRSCLNKRGELVADDGTKLSVNDHVYLVCEPPGDPYYLCRIMEFLHVDSDNPASPIDSMRVNWYYRPRDVQRFNSDTRLVYGTMHSDMCPITSLRGKCIIKHRSEIDDLELYRKERDSFYFVQVFDRFIRRWYECIPVAQIINVPEKVKKALDERWKFVVVELGRVKELTSAVKTCKRCGRYCASHDSVDCAICKNSYHMNCVQPPLPKKPSRGFAWACGPCSRASERQTEGGNTPTVSGDVTEAEEEMVEDDEPTSTSNDNTRAPSPSGSDVVMDNHPATQAEIELAKMWPMRYLGIHCRVEDALQYDDRAIYPRASSRLGPRHQANVNMWHGRPVELVKPADIKKRYQNAKGKNQGKLTKETLAAIDADREEKVKRPKWVQDAPPGYVARGEDYEPDDPRCTAKLMFRMPPADVPSERSPEDSEAFINNYVKRAKQLARGIGVPPFGVNFLDKALELLVANDYDVTAALEQLQKVDRRHDLHEPVLSKPELAKFEEGVAKYGSEHRLVRLHMKTHLPNADIVRFYYLWKKTPKGREIWGNYGGRKGSKRKVESDTGARLQAEVANDGDDSAFDNEKAVKRHRGFECKFCHTTHARQWRKAPGVSAGQTVTVDGKNGNKDKKEKLLLALCLRCAGLWRKYAIQWEDIDEVSKKVAQGGSRALKRRIDEELLREVVAANEASSMPPEPAVPMPSIETSEPPKKKSKTDKDAGSSEATKKKEKPPPPPPPPKEPTPPPPPIIPVQPLWRTLPCVVCKLPEDTVACDHCNLTVHRRCFGLSETDGLKADGKVKWLCDQCQNDRNPQVSTDYSCCLCLTEETLIDLVEPPRVSHKKKNDRERERERLEKELADVMRADYCNKQLALNRPLMPREPLKRTTGNNWVHVYCAIWTPEIRFSNAKALEVAEGFQLIPPARYEAVCKLCKNKDHEGKVRKDAGACVSCATCQDNFHIACAFEAGHKFGFDVTPVKGSRKDQITTAKLGEETGALTPMIWCKEHAVKTVVHPMSEVVDETGKTALQVYVENYKQADLTLTGTVRKANLAQLTKEKVLPIVPAPTNGARRESTANSIAAAVRRGARTSSVAETKTEAEDGVTEMSDVPEAQVERRCAKCKIDVTPRWHPFVKESHDNDTNSQRSPQWPAKRLSMTLGEIADMERQRSMEVDRQNGGLSVTNEPLRSQSQSQNQNNIRFMAPGASGRAWDGMPDRYTSRPLVNGEISSEQLPGAPALFSRESAAPEVNGELRPSFNETRKQGTDDGTPNHVLQQNQNSTLPPKAMLHEHESTDNNRPQEYLCHKCFLKKKLGPTPPPPERLALSPPRQYGLQLDWSRPSGPPTQPAFDFAASNQPLRMPWDEPPGQHNQPQHPPPPQGPPVNGMGPSAGFGPPLNQSQAYGPPPPLFAHQPNGYSAVPPSVPPPMHARHPSFGFGAQQPPPPPPPPPPPAYATPHGPHRPPPLNGYQSTSQPMPNGLTSPRGSHPMQSPTYPPPQPPHQQYSARRTESPFPSQLPPIGPPLHSGSHAGSPAGGYARADVIGGPPPPPLPQHSSPQTNPVWPSGQQAGRGPAPRDVLANAASGTGASASPSLRNLLH